MQQIRRRRLIKLAGVGTVLAAGIGVPLIAPQAVNQVDFVRFRGTLGLPEPPLPSYATYLIEGTLNLVAGTGMIASRVVAGHPGEPSEIALPGLARIIQVNAVDTRGSQLVVRGVIQDRSQLQPGESPQVELIVDRARGLLYAPFGGRSVTMSLA